AAPSWLLRLPLAPLRAALQEQHPVWRNLKNWLRLHTLLHFHRERTFLGFMSGGSALKLHDRLRPAAFGAGQTIQANGLAADCWYLIDEGTVRLQAAGEPDTAGGGLGPGESVGERAPVGGGGGGRGGVPSREAGCWVVLRHASAPGVRARSMAAQAYEPLLPARPDAHVWVPQLEKADCGLAALAMVGRRLGAWVSVEELRQKVAPGPGGLTLAQLRAAAAEIGLPCQAVRVSGDRLGAGSL